MRKNLDPVTYYALDGQSVAMELKDANQNGTLFDQNGQIEAGEKVATYLVAPRGVEYRRDETTGQVSWYIYDGLGSVLAEVDGSGNTTSAQAYYAYGTVRPISGVPGTVTKHKFVGSLGHTTADDPGDTGLIYMRARYYDAEIGRFISEDPAEDGVNWYAYCDNNPINRFDRSGKWDDVAWAAEAGGFAFGLVYSAPFRLFADSFVDHFLVYLTPMDPLFGGGDLDEIKKFAAYDLLGKATSLALKAPLPKADEKLQIVAFYVGYAASIGIAMNFLDIY